MQVEAACVYQEPARLFLPAPAAAGDGRTAQQAHDDVLDIGDVMGKRIIATRLHRQIILREEYTAAALEAISRFAVNPKWQIYLP